MNEKTAIERQTERFKRKLKQVNSKYIKKIEELPKMPKSVKPFLEVLKSVHIDLESVPFVENRKIIGTLCVMIPSELIYAAGGIPIRLCSGSYTAYQTGDDIMPRDSCPLVKAVMGFESIKISLVYNKCNLIIAPTSCDCKRKTAGMLSKIKNTEIVYVPVSKDKDEYTEYFLKEMYRIVPVIEDFTGNKITYQSFVEALNILGFAQYQFSKLIEYRRHNLSPVYGTHIMAALNAIGIMPIEKWAKYAEELNKELEERIKDNIFTERENQPRIVITGSPIIFPNFKLPLLIEQSGGFLIGDETCMGERSLYDPVVITEPSFDGIMRALANRYIKPCTCPSFSDNSQRIYKLKQLIKDTKAEGVIYHVLRGCLVYDFEYSIIENELEKDGIPVIRIESDYNEEDIEMIRVRVEAFIEMLKIKNFPKKEVFRL